MMDKCMLHEHSYSLRPCETHIRLSPNRVQLEREGGPSAEDLGVSTSFGYLGVYFSKRLFRPRPLTFQKIFEKSRTFYTLINRQSDTHTQNGSRAHRRETTGTSASSFSTRKMARRQRLDQSQAHGAPRGSRRSTRSGDRVPDRQMRPPEMQKEAKS